MWTSYVRSVSGMDREIWGRREDVQVSLGLQFGHGVSRMKSGSWIIECGPGPSPEVGDRSGGWGGYVDGRIR